MSPLFGYPTVPESLFKKLVKCQWLSCAGGGALSGSGRCFLYGMWWHPSCQCFIPEPDDFDQFAQDEINSLWDSGYRPRDFMDKWELIYKNLESIFPAISGRAYNLAALGEECAANRWADMASVVLECIKNLNLMVDKDHYL
jgi:hypothetical protein